LLTYSQKLTADDARNLLEKNVWYDRESDGRTNRPISKLRVGQYASAMLRGEWRLTHQGIAFDLQGKLIDGQHRLLALVQAAETQPEIEVEFQINEDVDTEVFDVVDTGNMRSGKDILALLGERDPLNLNAAVRHLYLFYNVPHFQWGRTRVTNHQIREMLSEHPTIRDEVVTSKKLVPIGITGTAAAVGLYVCREVHAPGMEEFVDGLRHGAGLEKRDPRLTFRNFLIRSKSVGVRRYDTRTHLAMWIKTWNDFQAGRERDVIRWATTELFPQPIEPKNASKVDANNS
jgi:hypothetical protein